MSKNDKKIPFGLKGFTILIADGSSAARGIFGTYVTRARGQAITTTNGADALTAALNNKIDLIITDIDLPDMNGFDLIAGIRAKNVDVPSIIITTLDIDEYISLAIEKDIGNILTKEISEDAFVRTCHNLITGNNIFGLDHYIPGVASVKSLKITCSSDIHSTIRLINEFGVSCGMSADQKPFLAVILDEIISNAVYHAHGYTREKVSRKPVALKENEVVEISYGNNSSYLGISVTDFMGTLTKQKILSSFLNVVAQKKLLDESKKLNIDVTDMIPLTGRGLQMIRLMSNDYYFNIKRNSMTQVVALVNISDKAIVYHNSSIRITEIV